MIYYKVAKKSERTYNEEKISSQTREKERYQFDLMKVNLLTYI